MKLVPWFFLFGCKPLTVGVPDSGGPELVPGESATPDDSAEPEEPEEPEIPAIFEQDRIHEIAIFLPPEGAEALGADPYGWVHADVTIDGETVSDIGLRLRGKIGSFRTLDGKPKFKLDFKEFQEDQRFQGLKHLSLNNSVVDCSYLREAVGYSLFHEAGYPASLWSFARVSVNGEPYGLYLVVEVPDDEYLERNFTEPKGNLYDGKYLWYGGWNYDMADFTPSQEDVFELEEGEDVGLADIHAITVAAGGSGSFVERFDALIDLDMLHRYMLMEQWIGHLDGYVLNTNNYRVFFRPEDGKAVFLPWDLDYAFLSSRSWGMSWNRPEGIVAQICWNDDDCRAAQAEALANMDIDVGGLITRARGWAELIREDALSDPRRECQSYEVEPEQDEVIGWMEGSRQRLEDAWD